MKNLGDVWASGTGIFETIRVEENQVFALHRHHCRAREAAEKLGFQIPDEAMVKDLSYQVISEHDYRVGRMRWHFDRTGEFSISYVPFTDPQAGAILGIISERTSNYEIRNKEYPYQNLKTLSESQAQGFDDGIILTADGQLTETTVASLLLKIGSTWVTPPLSSGILNGVVRALVLESGLATVRRIDESELPTIESGLLLTSLRNAQPIAQIAGRNLVIDHEKCAEIHKLMSQFKGH